MYFGVRLLQRCISHNGAVSIAVKLKAKAKVHTMQKSMNAQTVTRTVANWSSCCDDFRNTNAANWSP